MTKKGNGQQHKSILKRKFTATQGCILIFVGLFLLMASCGILANVTDSTGETTLKSTKAGVSNFDVT